ncbi:MAG TPA: tetratricopeptide repeat protein [Pyrinomonadaceae bacterium]|nr:tetratricopeptide repeat protein [Pyrinomonadaceae bacterium]
MLANQSNTNNRKHEIQEKLVIGEITISEAVGLNRKQLYAIARRGYQLMNSGKLEEARLIYAGLVAADPFDSVFHCHLGAIHWKLGDVEKAFAEYDAALRFNIANVDALAGRGELYLLKGEVKQGIEDLRKALENDPHAFRPATVRARALLLSLHQVANKKAAA